MKPFRTVLIANRGEIAVRISRTLREMGIRSVAVYSEADRGAPHVSACDEAVEIGPAPAAQSYLDASRILDAARRTGADAVHPGYGFLSQSAAFAEACAAAGLTFIGPSPAALRRMGDKQESRATAERAGVPVVPGTGAIASLPELLSAIRSLGLPVMLKALAGGGGKGMRRIDREKGVEEEAASARREAEAAFGDGRLLVEKTLSPVRHVEVQIVGDSRGTVRALGERDCTLQRRFQKIVEESPSPAVDAALRAQLCEAAVRVAAAAKYENAGTVEFLLRPDGSFFFLEMNARLQVEHPVTEMVTGLDLVRLQIEIAQGSALPEIPSAPRGHAIEARLYAEQPEKDFRPSGGKILRLAWPVDVRVDHALTEGATITSHYDPMLAKIIVCAPTREEARRNLVEALRGTILLGVHTNLNYLIGLLESHEFVSGDLATDRLPFPELPELPLAAFAAALTATASRPRGRRSPWETLGRWRVGG